MGFFCVHVLIYAHFCTHFAHYMNFYFCERHWKLLGTTDVDVQMHPSEENIEFLNFKFNVNGKPNSYPPFLKSSIFRNVSRFHNATYCDNGVILNIFRARVYLYYMLNISWQIIRWHLVEWTAPGLRIRKWHVT